MLLRYLGILLPLAMTYGFGFRVWGPHQVASLIVVLSLAAASWIGFAAALSLKRDWAGALAVSVFYVLVDAWMWLVAFDVLGRG